MTGPLSGVEVAKALLSDHHPLDALRCRKAWRHLGDSAKKYDDFAKALPEDKREEVLMLMRNSKP